MATDRPGIRYSRDVPAVGVRVEWASQTRSMRVWLQCWKSEAADVLKMATAGFWVGVFLGLFCLVISPGCSVLTEGLHSLGLSGSAQPGAIQQIKEAAAQVDSSIWGWLLAYFGIRTAGTDAAKVVRTVSRHRRKRALLTNGATTNLAQKKK